MKGLLHGSRSAISTRTSTNDAHGEDCVVGDLWVTVVRELAERVQDLQFGVGDGDQAESERDGSLDPWFSVPQLEYKTSGQFGNNMYING